MKIDIWGFLQYFAVVLIGIIGLDAMLFYALPIQGVELNMDACPDWSAGCCHNVYRSDTMEAASYPYVRYPAFSVAFHEHLHATGIHEEVTPSLVSAGIMILISMPVFLAYDRFVR